MSGANRLSDYLVQMIQGARDARTFVDGLDREAFMADLRTQRAVAMSLMIVGDAAARVVTEHPGFTQTHPDIPWRSIRGMRNRIAHGYFDIDLDVVWRTVEAELPELIVQLDKVSG